jgi:hypothetical protein
MTDDLMIISPSLIADPLNGWESRTARKMQADAYASWLAKLADWKIFITLTFKDPTSGDVANWQFRRLLQVLNKDAFGKRYVRKVGHSYFSYAVATEYQRRDVIHFHALADKPINMNVVHSYWNHAAGWAWIEPVKNLDQVTSYCSKYCVKGGQVEVYMTERPRIPMIGSLPPYWWIEKKALAD